MTNVDFYKRIVQQYFWDPEPTNDAGSQSPIWCLGEEYKGPESVAPKSATSRDEVSDTVELPKPAQAATPPDSTASSVDSALAYGDSQKSAQDGEWPTAFLDDFEARLWFTYRSNFPAIPKSQDPKALSSMSLKVRLKSQLVDQGGFTSDTGWGCMIRSGQSLLANALIMLQLGRGLLLASSSSVASTNMMNRLAPGILKSQGTRDTFTIRGRSSSSLLDSQICRTWCYCLREAPRRVVWAFSNCSMHSVRIT